MGIEDKITFLRLLVGVSLYSQMTRSQISTLKKEKKTALVTVLQPDIHVCSDVEKVLVTS